jgi:peptidylprolyl isomerase
MQSKLRLLSLGSALLIPLVLSCSGDEPMGEDGAKVAGDPKLTADLGDAPAEAWTDEVITSYKRGKEAKMLIEIFEMGEGKVVEEYDRLKIHYRGWIPGETMAFDASYGRGAPLAVTLGVTSVIEGWTMGLLGLTVGTRARLHIPPALGYGASGFPPLIGSNEKLIFDIKVVSAK